MKRLLLVLVGTPLIIMALLVVTEQLAISGTAVEMTGVDWPSDGPQLPLKQAGTGPPPQADLALSKVGSPEPATVGEPLTYTLTVVNQGSTEATGIWLVDFLPANVEFGAAAATPPAPCSQTGLIVSCTLVSLANLDTATVTIVVTPTQAGSIFNTAAVASSAPEDPDLNNNTAIEQTAVNPAMPVKIFLPIIFKNYP